MKQFLNRKNGIKSVYLVLCVLAVIVVLLINVVSTALTDRYPLTIDLTAGRLFQLDAATVAYLQTLEHPVTIQVLATEERFAANSTYNAQANEVMRQFAKQSDAVSIEYIDYVKNPAFAAQYPDLVIKHGDVLVSSGERYKLVKTEELFQYAKSQSGQLTIASSKAEQAIGAAVIYVVSEEIPAVAVITGHREADTTAFVQMLESNNFSVTTCQLATQEIPAQTDIVLLAAPKNDLSAEELTRLDAFLKNGGAYGKTLLYCADPQQGALPNIKAFLGEWGVLMGEGLVFETDPDRVYRYQPFYAVADYVSETFSDLLRSTDVPMLVPVSRPLSLAFQTREAYQTETLLAFGATTGVRPADAGDSFTADQAVIHGPMPALVLCSYTLRDRQNANRIEGRSQVIVSGSVELLSSYAVGNTAFSNAEYLTGLFNRLCQRENSLLVAPKTLAGAPLNFTQQTADKIGALFVWGIPAAVLALGLAVWLCRRNQ